MNREEFWKGFAKRAAEKGLTQTEAAEKLGMQQSGLSHIMSGRRNFPDPRRKNGRDFYKRLSKFVGNIREDDLIEKLYYKSNIIEKTLLDQNILFREFILNLRDNREALPLVVDCLQSYIKNVKGKDWLKEK